MAEQQQVSGVATQVAHIAEAQQQTAIVLERVIGRLDGHDKQFAEIARERDREAEWQERRTSQAPEVVRGWLVVGLMVAGMLLTGLCSATSLLVSLLPHLR